jgi:undecaprenyl-diphosphatase
MPEPPPPFDLWTSIVLGAVQGATEFLPISSDGHIALLALLFGHTEMPLSMVVLLHVGTLIATLLVFRSEVAELAASIARGLRAPRTWLKTREGRSIAAIAVASIPTALIGLALREAAEGFARVPWIVGACLLGTAVCVASTRWTATKARRDDTAIPLSHAVVVGIAQGLAVLPGLSRSGSTIATLMLLGTAGPAAFRVSFLMSLPAVLGAAILELRHPDAVLADLGTVALAGVGVSFGVGLASLLVLRRLIDRGRFWAFACYLVPLGTALIAWGSAG